MAPNVAEAPEENLNVQPAQEVHEDHLSCILSVAPALPQIIGPVALAACSGLSDKHTAVASGASAMGMDRERQGALCKV